MQNVECELFGSKLVTAAVIETGKQIYKTLQRGGKWNPGLQRWRSIPLYAFQEEEPHYKVGLEKDREDVSGRVHAV